MGAFYVNCCVRGLNQGEVLDLLRRTSREGYVGPTVNGWTALVAEDLESQDLGVIEAYGCDLTRGSDRVALTVLCHDEDVLKVGLFRGGRQVGEFDSAPDIFRDPGEIDPDTLTGSRPPPTEEETRPVLHGAEAFAEAFGLSEAAVMDLLPRADHEAARRVVETGRLDPARAELLLAQGLTEGPIELHERWSATLGLPEYAIAMGYDAVEGEESEVEWASTSSDEPSGVVIAGSQPLGQKEEATQEATQVEEVKAKEGQKESATKERPPWARPLAPDWLRQPVLAVLEDAYHRRGVFAGVPLGSLDRFVLGMRPLPGLTAEEMRRICFAQKNVLRVRFDVAEHPRHEEVMAAVRRQDVYYPLDESKDDRFFRLNRKAAERHLKVLQESGDLPDDLTVNLETSLGMSVWRDLGPVMVEMRVRCAYVSVPVVHSELRFSLDRMTMRLADGEERVVGKNEVLGIGPKQVFMDEGSADAHFERDFDDVLRKHLGYARMLLDAVTAALEPKP